MGTQQSGAGSIRFAEFLADASLIRESREVAEGVLRDDPFLKGNAKLRAMIEQAIEIEPR